MGPKKDTVLDPNDPRILWQYFTRLEQNAKGKWKSQCQCCGKFYIDFTPSKILEHYGFESTRATPAKFKACKGIDNEENKQVKETAQRIHAAQFMAKSAQKAAKAQGSCTQQAADDEYFVSHGLNVDQLRASGHLPVHNSAIGLRSLRQRDAAQSKLQRGRITGRECRSTGGSEAIGSRKG